MADENPGKETEAELLVIGGGPGGYVAAIRAAQLGKKVTLVDTDEKLGGVCLNTGCIPTKAMIHASDYYYQLGKAGEMGISVGDYSIDMAKMVAWKDGIVSKLNNGISSLFRAHGIMFVKGKAAFESTDSISVEGNPGVSSIKFGQCIIATGSSSIEIPGFKFDGEKIISSTEALSLKEIPKKIVIIGGGYIGTELGTVYGKLGSEVHIVEATSRLIPVLGEDLVAPVQKKLSEFNVRTYFNAKATGFEEKEGHVAVKVDQQGKELLLDADKVMVVVGRRPNTSGIGLEKAQVKAGPKGFIAVDKQLRTSQKNIFAIGDAAGQPMLAHKASREGKVAAEAACGMSSAFDNKAIPSVVFNDPEIASVGMDEAEAGKQGYEVLVGKFPFSALGRAATINSPEGFVKFVADRKTGIVLGVHIVGADASDLISEGALAIEMCATLDDVALTIHPHPTLSEGLMEAAEATLGHAIHIFSPK